MVYKTPFGYPEEQVDCARRNQAFLARFHNLTLALDFAFDRNVKEASIADRAIFLQGRLCIEDFMECLVLAGSGYGVGAMKLVRGLYERAVVTAYLSNHPDDAQAFMDWRFVTRYKTLAAYVGGVAKDPIWLRRFEDAKQKYSSVKQNYEVDDCEECGTKKTNHTWHRLDFVAMAKSTGDLGKLLAQAYYHPLSHGHATSEAIVSRLRKDNDGAIIFQSEAQRGEADMALKLAHTILLAVIETQMLYFKVDGLKDKLDVCLQDFEEIYGLERNVVDL